MLDVLHRMVLRHWARRAEAAETSRLPELRQNRAQARALRGHLDRVIHVAAGRLAGPDLGKNPIRKPIGSDWAWRPEVWRGPLPCKGLVSAAPRTMLGSQITVFHDCARAELLLRQIRNTQQADLAPFGVSLEAFRFDGSFLSLAIDLPEEAATGLLSRHLVRLEMQVDAERPPGLVARLNVQYGPNHDEILRDVPPDQPYPIVEFDIAYTGLGKQRADRLWLDLIVQAPEMNRIVLRDLTLTRLPRAEL